MKNTLSSEVCKQCAECCKNFAFIELSQDEIFKIVQLTGLPFEAFTNPKGESPEAYFMQFKENGDCYFLTGRPGQYSCGVYAARSKVCRNYPSKPVQDEVCDANRKMIQRNLSRGEERPIAVESAFFQPYTNASPQKGGDDE
jgi:uncharacterized protein